MTYYTLNAISNTMTSKFVTGVKITRITKLEWNNMEGQKYQVNIKIITIDGYQNKFVRMITNDSWLDEWQRENETLHDYLENLFNDLAA